MATVVIVTWNNHAGLRRCLETIRVGHRGVPLQIVLVDNASSYSPVAEIINHIPTAEVIVNEENRGFAQASNQGIRVARGQYILLLNADATLRAGALEEMVAYMDDHPEVGLLGPKLLDPDGSLQFSCRQFPTYSAALFNRYSLLTRLFPRNRYSQQYLRSDRSHDQIEEVDWVSGACMLVRREAIEEVGLLDEALFMYCEDVDWCKRMWAKGWKVVYFPKGEVIHHVGQSTSQAPFRMILERHKSIWRYCQKHFARGPVRDAVTFTGVAARCGCLLAAQVVRTVGSLLAELIRPEGRAALVKRTFDIWLSEVGLLIGAPVWALAAIAIKLEDGGPVCVQQLRVGQGGRRFQTWKFRSMVSDSEKRFGPLQAKGGDSRVTRVGRLLRATALDELPQLWNIFKGDMSFVGPRALLPEEIEVNGNGELVPIEKIPGYEARHRIKPGLTGMAQVYAPRDIPRRHKFKFDLLYIKNRTFWLDLKLIALSIWISFRGRWEARGRKC